MERSLSVFDRHEDYQDHPGVLARPPLIALGFLALGLALDRFAWSVPVYEPARFLGGAGLCIAGAALMCASVRRFREAGTSMRTTQPAIRIVRDGPYAHFRNPMYGALILVYFGIGVLANAPAVVALAPLLYAVLHYGVVLREEHYLECKFGDGYLAYKQAVPRWL